MMKNSSILFDLVRSLPISTLEISNVSLNYTFSNLIICLKKIPLFPYFFSLL